MDVYRNYRSHGTLALIPLPTRPAAQKPLWPLSQVCTPQSSVHPDLSPGFPSRHSRNNEISVSIASYQYVIRGPTDTFSIRKHIKYALYFILRFAGEMLHVKVIRTLSQTCSLIHLFQLFA